MSSSRLLPRPSPPRPKPSNKAALQPAQIPLPPSPPASDALVLDDPFAPPPLRSSSSSKKQPRRVSPRAKASSSRLPSRPRDNHRVLEGVVEPKLPVNETSTRTRPQKRPAIGDPFDSSSPPTSPTNRKSAQSVKRLKASSSPSTRGFPTIGAPALDHRDSPNNPFLAKPGEKPRRAGSRREDGQRQLIYVFRGKRIPYETAEDLNHTGGSPFGSSGPKLLFPSPPSPAPARKLKFEEVEDEEGQGVGGSRSAHTSPQRASNRNQAEFQTPKRDKGKANGETADGGAHMLPTPQSRPRRADLKHAHHSNLRGVVKSGKTMAKAMR